MSTRVPIRRSLLRRIVWFGGDRRLVGFGALLLFLMTIMVFRSYGVLFGFTFIIPLVVFLVILWVAREANKADPWMVDVVLRQFRYRKYYAAKPDLGTEHPSVKDYA